MDDRRIMKDVFQISDPRAPVSRSRWGWSSMIAAAVFAVGLGPVSTADAAGPRAGEFYVQLGGGVFGPKFNLAEDAQVERVDGPQETSTLSIGRFIDIQLSGDTGESREERPENVDVIAFGGSLGYKFTDRIGAEIDLDIIFPEIQINDVGAGDVIGGDNNAGEVNVLQPGILPVAVSAIYTFSPESLVSPYIGLGPLIGNFREGRAWMDSGDLLKVQGSMKIGIVGKVGVLLTVSQASYLFVEGRYGYIDSPEVRDRQGEEVKVDSFEMISVKGGVGFNF
ncbi:hypothetical protein GXC69_02160 [Candidatus Macondimonas diazotrophica]|nr:hypothetical protein [Candidatus Macondimonas diazotrophica]